MALQHPRFHPQLEPRRHQQPPRRSQLQVPALWRAQLRGERRQWEVGVLRCKCANTEAGKRAIATPYPAKTLVQIKVTTSRLPLKSKPIRPKADRAWTYCDQEGKPIRKSAAQTMARATAISSSSPDWEGRRPKDVAHQVVPYGFQHSKPLKMALLSSSSPRVSHAPMPCAARAWLAMPPRPGPMASTAIVMVATSIHRGSLLCRTKTSVG